MLHLTELIAEQLRTLGVMFCAGVLIESLWIIRCGVLARLEKAGRQEESGAPAQEAAEPASGNGRRWGVRILVECIFWIFCGICLSAFLYYCAFGRITFHGVIGFLAGLLLWKKICCGIMNARK